MDTQKNALFPNIPTLKEQTGSDWTIGAWRGIVGPKGLPQNVSQRLIAALEKIYNGNEYKDFMSQRGFGVRYAAGSDFLQFWTRSDQDLGAVMKKVGLAK